MEMQPDRQGSAMVTDVQVGYVFDQVARWGSLALLVLTLFGTVLALNGGWAASFDANGHPTISVLALGAGLGVGGLLIVWQWAMARRPWHPGYVIPLALSSFLSYSGFADVLVPFFTAGTGSRVLGAVVTLVVVVSVDIVPERMLVRRVRTHA